MNITSFSQTRHWRIFKRIVLGVVVLISLVSFTSIVIISQKKEWILQKLVNYANTRQSGEIEIGTLDLSWLTHLPNVAIEVNDLNFFERPSNTRGVGELPILHAAHAFVTIDVWMLIRESAIEISEVGIQNASLNLEKDSLGVFNILKALATPGTKSDQALTINLESVRLDSVMVTLKSQSAQPPSVFLLREMQASLQYVGAIITCKLKSTQALQAFYLKNTFITEAGEVATDLDLTYDPVKQDVILHSGTLTYQQLKVAVKGSYNHQNDRALEVYFDGSSNEFVLLKSLIKENIIKLNKDLLSRGKIDMQGKIYGKLLSGRPQLEFNIVAAGIDLTLPDRLGEFKNIGFEGTFKSGEPNDLSDAVLEIRNLKGKIPGGSIAGHIRVENFTRPAIDYHLDASARLDGFDRIFKFTSVKDLKGTISLQSDYKGMIDFSKPNPPDNPANALVTFKNLSFTSLKSKKRISGVNGKIILANYGLSLDQLQLQYDRSLLLVNGTLTHPYQLLMNHESDIEATLKIRSDKFYTQDFIADTLLTVTIQDTITNFQLDVGLATTVSNIRNQNGIPDFDFEIKNLSADFEKLPDLKQVIATGAFHRDTLGIKLKLKNFLCKTPVGSFGISGELNVLEKNKLDFDVLLSVNGLPLKYLGDLINELQTNPEPRVTTLSLEEMKTVTADLDLSLSLLTGPFTVKNLEIRKGNADLRFPDASHWKADKFMLQVEDLFFRNPTTADSINGTKSASYVLNIDPLILPGVGKSSVNLSGRGADDPGSTVFELKEATLLAKLPQGSLVMRGDLVIPEKNSVTINARVTLDQFPWTNFEALATLFQSQGKGAKRSPSMKDIIVTSADFNLSTSLTVQPFGVMSLEALKSQADIRISDSTQVKTGMFSLNLHDLYFDQQVSKGAGLKSIKGNIKFDSIPLPIFGKRAIQLNVDGLDDQLKFNFSSTILHANKDEGNILLDLSAEIPEYQIHYSIDKIKTEYVSNLIRGKESISGAMDLKLDLQGSGTGKSAIDSLKGSVVISGENLTIYRVDLDGLLKDYKKSQNFNFVDVGAFMVAGPVGPVVTKGSDFVSLMTQNMEATDKTNIVQFFLDAKISDSEIITEDVALATPMNRIALHGKIDYFQKTIPGLTIAVIDINGCSLMDQKVYGKFDHVQYGKLNVAGTLFGSVTNLANAVGDKNCKPVYEGAVKHQGKK